ncbi:phospholipase D-like domain-containing protein [Shewanella decolorationis]|uniref:Pld-like domain protein n=1 Tax=Shewanella decolorationis S12 TaxID=1353536 RepID=A0ABN0PPL2_9GAMM|nr:phospholipase D-like domain-containing protein [Shewanella decolorationis]ESE42057.1 pld-like domain protein [Shewanella decolorationis S12]GLR34092.1 hypothetical protein GCM10007922_36510 [Shewanella decolorationis]
MEKDYELFFRNVTRRWQNELKKATSVEIYSPYITSSTAETVTSSLSSGQCDIYTLFSAELFINLSSSIQTLITLKKRGFELYALPSLHAKCVIVPNEFASIGSQNLTRKGTKNLEATAVFTNQTAVNRVCVEVSKWKEHRKPLSLDVLKDMQKQVKPHLQQYQQIKTEANRIDEEVIKKERARELAIAEQLAAQKRYYKRLSKLASSIKNINKSQRSISGRVKYLPTDFLNATNSFVANDTRNSFVTWNVENKKITLARTYRYLCLLKKTGKIGWARVVKSRITYFEKSIAWHNPIAILGYSCIVTFEANWNLEADSSYNVTVEIKLADHIGLIRLYAWFGGNELIINNIDTPGWSKNSKKQHEDLLVMLRERPQEASNILLSNLLKPFRYVKNLTGVQANNFFPSTTSNYIMYLANYLDHPFLIIE